LTGDAIAIAKETCRMLALGTKVYSSERLMSRRLMVSPKFSPSTSTKLWRCCNNVVI
jgi:hypothetical protein